MSRLASNQDNAVFSLSSLGSVYLKITTFECERLAPS
jgi:hypothetical protein